MDPQRALREASRNRLRPITMTMLAANLTLMPLALAIGQASALQFPLVLLPVLIGFTIEDPAGAKVKPTEDGASRT
jgi:multidrug efflux pump subunit AcrB